MNSVRSQLLPILVIAVIAGASFFAGQYIGHETSYTEGYNLGNMHGVIEGYEEGVHALGGEADCRLYQNEDSVVYAEYSCALKDAEGNRLLGNSYYWPSEEFIGPDGNGPSKAGKPTAGPHAVPSE